MVDSVWQSRVVNLGYLSSVHSSLSANVRQLFPGNHLVRTQVSVPPALPPESLKIRSDSLQESIVVLRPRVGYDTEL